MVKGAELYARAKKLKKFPNKYFSGVFKKHSSQVTRVWRDKAPTLAKKIELHIEMLEKNQAKVDS